MLFLASSFTIASTSCHSSSGSLSIRSTAANLFFTSTAYLSGMSHKLYLLSISFFFLRFSRLLQLDLYSRNKQLMIYVPQSATGIVFADFIMLRQRKVAVCGQYLGYDRNNERPLVSLQCYFECIKIDASLTCRPYLQINNHYNRHCTYSGVTLCCH